MMELIGIPQDPPAAFAAGAVDEAEAPVATDTDLAVAPEGPRLGPGPGHPDVMSWARAM
jgi:hypothetical protein